MIKLTRTQWLICIIAAIGFAFDIYELLMLPLIIKPALAALGGLGPDGLPLLVPGSAEYVQWARTLFFVPAIAGGVFGLLGGYLTDRLGRRRVLTFSILLYAFSACAAGYATSLPQLLVFRCLVFIGVCVEFVAAVAWLAELFPDRDQREKVLGYTQAFSSFGGLLVGAMNVLAAKIALRPAGHSRRPRGLALHPHLRRHPGDSADSHPPVPAGIARVGTQTRRRPAQAPEHRRTVQSGAVAHHRAHDARLRRELRHRLRRDPATPANPRRATHRHAARKPDTPP